MQNQTKFIGSIKTETTLTRPDIWETWFRGNEDKELAFMLYDTEAKRMHVSNMESFERCLLEDFGELCFWANDAFENQEIREAVIEKGREFFSL